MDRADLDHLEALHRAATPGPWRADATDPDGSVVTTAPVFDDGGDVVEAPDVVAPLMPDADARLIVAARNALPHMLARLRALEEVARAAEEVLNATNAESVDVTGDDEEVEAIMDATMRMGAALTAAKGVA